MSGDEISFEVRFIARESQVDLLPEGTRIIYGAVVASPERYRGQVRDLILWAGGGVSLGRNQQRRSSDGE
jgi:hypothetical protein